MDFLSVCCNRYTFIALSKSRYPLYVYVLDINFSVSFLAEPEIHYVGVVCVESLTTPKYSIPLKKSSLLS